MTFICSIRLFVIDIDVYRCVWRIYTCIYLSVCVCMCVCVCVCVYIDIYTYICIYARDIFHFDPA